LEVSVVNKQIRNAAPSNDSITRGALPGSCKVYVAASGAGVPFREVALSGGEPPVRLYDTSGPYTDGSAPIDITKGLAPLRRDWSLARGDVEEYEGRHRRPEDDGLKPGELLSVPQFDRAGLKPLRARPGRRVTQLEYARAGIITKEMEYIAVRENLGRSALADGESWREHPR
jgi:phosphomethylpyrimidine synthase